MSVSIQSAIAAAQVGSISSIGEDPLELLDGVVVGRAVGEHQAVQVEAPLHVLEPALDRAAVVERQRRQGFRPSFAEVVGLGLLLIAAQEVGRPGFGAERDLVGLVEREQVGAAALIEEAAKNTFDREDRARAPRSAWP